MYGVGFRFNLLDLLVADEGMAKKGSYSNAMLSIKTVTRRIITVPIVILISNNNISNKVKIRIIVSIWGIRWRVLCGSFFLSC